MKDVKKDEKKDPAHTICVCGGSKCEDHGSKKVRKKFKEAIEEEGLGEYIAVKKTDCLGQCGKGPVVQVKPEKDVHTEVSKKDVNALIKDIAQRRR